MDNNNNRDNKEYQRLVLEEYQKRQGLLSNTRFQSDGPLSIYDYPQHKKFFDAGRNFTQRLFMAGNRTGKSEAGAFEIYCHVTGLYPDWWEGRRFDRPVKIWVAGHRSMDTRDIIQDKLIGPPGDTYAGFIPPNLIKSRTSKQGTPNAVLDLYIQHVSGGTSYIGFKSHKEGREAFQGTHMDVIWLDEECPIEVYQECLTRTTATSPGEENGLMILTFTPLMGLTPLIRQFTEDKSPNKIVIKATWDDAPHLTEEVKKEMLAAFPPHIREARTRGIPFLGAGTIYPVPEQYYIIEPIDIQDHWKLFYGLDVGWNNTSAVFCALDTDNDIVYVYGEYVGEQQHALINARAIKARGNIVGAVDTSIASRTQTDGSKMVDIYYSEGLELKMADKAVEAGISRIWERLQSGRMKVFSTCTNFMREIRTYHRDEKGKIVKANDHLMDAWRYAMNTGIHYAQPKAICMNPTYKEYYDYNDYSQDEEYERSGGY